MSYKLAQLEFSSNCCFCLSGLNLRWSFALFGILLMCFISPVFAQNVSSVEYVLKTTFEKSPDVHISSLNIDFREGRVMQASGEFNPVLNFGINKSHNVRPALIDERNGWLGLTPNESFSTDLLEYELAVTKRFQSGTFIKTALGLVNFGRDALYDDLSSAGFGDYITNRGQVFVDVTQPLLQGRGKKYYGATIEIEELRLSQAQLTYAFQVSAQAYVVLLNYLNVVSAKKELDIQLSIEKNYAEFEEQLRMLAEKDVIPKAELTFIKANLSRQHATVANSKSAYAETKNRLLEAMGISSAEVGKYNFSSMSYGIDSLTNAIEDGYLSYWLEKASTTRGDYLAAQKSIAINNREIEFADQQNQARLDVTLGLGYNGIYESNSFEQYVAPFYSNIPGVSYRAGLVFQWPMGMKTTKGVYASALAEKQISEEEVKSLGLNIQQQLSSYYNDIIYYNEAVKQAQKSVEYNLKARTNEYLKLQLGTSTVVNLVQVQNNYALAQTTLNRLKLALNSAIIKFRFESGNLIQISEKNEIIVSVNELFTLPNTTASNEK
ncbi:MAG: TolC family protein [Salibacteraceae bacterium]